MQIRIDQITERLNVRSLKPQGVERLKRKIAEIGYLPEKPVIISPNGDTESYTLIDGNHRIAALEALGIETVEALLDETLVTKALQLRRARLANEVSETIVPTTFVDDAELVWRLGDKTGENMTQTEVGGVLGWSRDKVKLYKALGKISEDTWALIGTTFNDLVPNGNNENGPTLGTSGPILTERLLRSILPLTSSQQLDLVTFLIANPDKKSKFTANAKAYKARNEMNTYTLEQLHGLPEKYTDQATQAIYSGSYDKDWETGSRPKLTRLIQSLLEEWEQKSGIQLLHGDFNVLVKDIADDSIDMILTDPPYNISDTAKVTKQGSKIVNAEFGGDENWDSEDVEQFKFKLEDWVKEWSRVLSPGGAIVAFCDKILISDLWRLFEQYGIAPKNTIVWAKSNPTPASLGRRNLISATEFMIWGVKPGTEYTFNDIGDWNHHNLIEAPLCAGDERIKDAQGNTLHPTQKPLKILLPLVEAFSNRGDTILDGFMGVGSVGQAAKDLNRRFIGIEEIDRYYQASQRRLGDE